MVEENSTEYSDRDRVELNLQGMLSLYLKPPYLLVQNKENGFIINSK